MKLITFRFIKIFLVFFLIPLLLSLPKSLVGNEPHSFYLSKIRQDPILAQELENIVKAGLKKAFRETAETPNVSPFFKRPVPIFITLRNARGETRACMGSLYPSENSLSEEIFHKIELALFKDPRHPAVNRAELKGMELFISEVGRPVPVRSMSQLSPARDGAYLRQGSREAVLLPGEAKTQRYMLALLKAKAGVLKGEPFQLYRLRSFSVRVRISEL